MLGGEPYIGSPDRRHRNHSSFTWRLRSAAAETWPTAALALPVGFAEAAQRYISPHEGENDASVRSG